ncbi:MAG: thermonuclease family protein [Polyangiales bacterium]
MTRAFALLPLALLGCIGSGPSGNGNDASVSADADATAPPADGPARPDASLLQDIPFVDSGCPASAPVPLSMVPSTGFLAPVRARFVRAVDGDTAHFVVPIRGEIIVRMLWVNTEESHGTETTAFGVATGNWAMQVMPSVAEYTLVPQADSRNPTQPALDPYDRTLALVFADGELWQRRLVREGRTAYYTDFGCAPMPIHNALLYAEAEARAAGRGIWAPGHPTDYAEVFSRWISNRCRPNPFRAQPYCTAP